MELRPVFVCIDEDLFFWVNVFQCNRGMGKRQGVSFLNCFTRGGCAPVCGGSPALRRLSTRNAAPYEPF
jgi:hypothetical protein